MIFPCPRISRKSFLNKMLQFERFFVSVILRIIHASPMLMKVLRQLLHHQRCSLQPLGMNILTLMLVVDGSASLQMWQCSTFLMHLAKRMSVIALVDALRRHHSARIGNGWESLL